MSCIIYRGLLKEWTLEQCRYLNVMKSTLSCKAWHVLRLNCNNLNTFEHLMGLRGIDGCISLAPWRHDDVAWQVPRHFDDRARYVALLDMHYHMLFNNPYYEPGHHTWA